MKNQFTPTTNGDSTIESESDIYALASMLQTEREDRRIRGGKANRAKRELDRIQRQMSRFNH